MTAYLLTDHLLNIMAPAAVMAVLLVMLNRFGSLLFRSKDLEVPDFTTSLAIIFIVNEGVLSAGLVVFGHDGTMATYAAMVVGAALALVMLTRSKKR